MAPPIRAVGTVASGTGAISPGKPEGTVRGDLLVMIAESQGPGSALTATGWTSRKSIVQGNTRCTLLTAVETGSLATTTNDTGDHQVARIIGIQKGTFHPSLFLNASSEGKQESTTALSIPGLITTIDECLILACSAAAGPDATGTSEFGAATNATLESLTERIDNSVTAGDGGAIYAVSGIKKAAGEVAATTLTASNAAERASSALAIAPFYLPVSDDFADGTVDPAIWDTINLATETGGKLRATTNNSYNGVATMSPRFPLRDSVITWLCEPPGAVTGRFVWNELFIDEEHAVKFVLDGNSGTPGQMQFIEYDEGDDVTQVAFDATEHLWRRLITVGNFAIWLTSPDGSTWTIRREKELVLDVDALWGFQVGSGYGGSAPSPAYIQIDNFSWEPYEEEKEPQKGRAVLSGAGTLTAKARKGKRGKASLSGSGTLTSKGRTGRRAKATLTAKGTLTADGVKGSRGKAVLSGKGELTARGKKDEQPTPPLEDANDLTSLGGYNRINPRKLRGWR